MKIFSYPRKIDDWRRKTSGLSLEERGIYSELIDWYYCTGGDLPFELDTVCRMIGATKRSERENVKKVINNPKLFSVDNSVGYSRLVQKMCDETLSSIADIRKTNSNSAKSRWCKNKELVDAGALPTQSERNAIQNLESKNYNKDNINLGMRIKISSEGIERAHAIANGWDVYYLENAFVAFVSGRERPKNPDAAFLAWIPKFTKGKRPGAG